MPAKHFVFSRMNNYLTQNFAIVDPNTINLITGLLYSLRTQVESPRHFYVADDVLRRLFRPHEYGDVILPFVVLRRLDCVLEPFKK